MLSHQQVKYVNSLKVKKYRWLHRAFIVEGRKNVEELLNSSLEVQAIYATPEWNTVRKNRPVPAPVLITADELKKISELTTPDQVLAVAGMPAEDESSIPVFSDLILVLDGIRDPGNMGTILRTADWFRIPAIVCSNDCVDIYNSKVVQATMGSITRVRVSYTDLTVFLGSLPAGIPVYGTLLEAPDITTYQFTKPGIIIIGNESNGISAPVLPFIKHPVRIPTFLSPGNGLTTAESLNASVANAIICYEIRKQLFTKNS